MTLHKRYTSGQVRDPEQKVFPKDSRREPQLKLNAMPLSFPSFFPLSFHYRSHPLQSNPSVRDGGKVSLELGWGYCYCGFEARRVLKGALIHKLIVGCEIKHFLRLAPLCCACRQQIISIAIRSTRII